MNLDNQKWYDKPVTKIILITISLTWMIPYVGFVLSSFRNEQAVKKIRLVELYFKWNNFRGAYTRKLYRNFICRKFK